MLNLQRFHDRKTLMIISILGIGIISIAYASGTVITDTSITTPNLTVTGTCTGCGGSGNFNTYTLILNATHTANNNICVEQFNLDNNLNGYFRDCGGSNGRIYLLSSSGSIINSFQNNYQVFSKMPIFSSDNEYSLFLATNNGTLYLFKNSVKIFSYVIGTTSGRNGYDGVSDNWALAISPNGKYIGIEGTTPTTVNRETVWQGS